MAGYKFTSKFNLNIIIVIKLLFTSNILKVVLIHFNSTQALKFSGRQLPDWGFNQHEVVTDKIISQDDTVWNVEEHRYTKSNSIFNTTI